MRMCVFIPAAWLVVTKCSRVLIQDRNTTLLNGVVEGCSEVNAVNCYKLLYHIVNITGGASTSCSAFTVGCH